MPFYGGQRVSSRSYYRQRRRSLLVVWSELEDVVLEGGFVIEESISESSYLALGISH
jgi:hypothetical protein